MSEINHTHTDDIIVDADVHFTIDPVTRTISNNANKKLTLMQYDNKSERYSFDVDRYIDGHDLMNCNKVQVHFFNMGSNREKHPGLYLVDDLKVNPTNDNQVTFSWLISQDATNYSGTLSFLITFKCVEEDEVLYRWSSSIYSGIQIVAGLDNNNIIPELYADELLTWQNSIEKEYIPGVVDERYIDREFATSEEVALIFSETDPDEIPTVTYIPYEEVTDVEIDNLFNIQGV